MCGQSQYNRKKLCHDLQPFDRLGFLWEGCRAYAPKVLQRDRGSSDLPLELKDGPDEHEEEFRAFRIGAGLAFRGRRLFVTDDGYVGLGPGRMRKGDVVCVVYGAHWLFLLRPYGNQFLVVGYCYVDGMMHGEMVEREDILVEDIFLA